MNRSRIRLMVVIMAVSLIGLLGFQGYWVHDAVQLKEKQFEREIRHVLFGVVSKLEAHETFQFFAGEAGKNISIQSDMIVLQGKDSISLRNNFPGSPFAGNRFSHHRRMQIRVESQESLLAKPVGFGVFRDEERRDNYNPNFGLQFLSKDSLTDKAKDSIHDAEIRKMEYVEQVVVKMMQSKKSLSERVSATFLDSLIHQELTESGVNEPYWFEVRKDNDQLVTQGPVNSENTGKVFLVRLFPNDFNTCGNKHCGGYLKLGFVGRKTGIWKALGIILPTSGVLSLLAMFAFGIILVALNRQKKLSDMKTDFINNMTHELKTPIATISLASEALSDPEMASGKDQVQTFARIIQEENQRLRDQVERVLQMAAFEKGEFVLKMRQLSLHEIIESECGRIAMWVKENNGQVSLNLEATKDEIQGDSVHISGIIANLLDNAQKYSPNNPTISIHTFNSGNNIILEITDKGIGMDRDVQKRVFDKFYRVPTGNVHDVKGFGLGLSYVKSMVEAHGGRVTVTSESGKGSTFAIVLPTKF